MEDLIKKFGSAALIRGDQLKDHVNPIVHFSPKVDMILGGGIPGGSVLVLAGPPKSGKTLSSLQIAANAQKGGRPIYFINVEGRIKPRDLDGIQGLDQSKIHIVRSYKEEVINEETGEKEIESRILSAEEFLEAVEYFAHNCPGAVIIIDSISQLITGGEMTKDMGDKGYAPGAALVAQLTKKLSNVIPVNDIILICICHVVASFQKWGKTTMISGGNKIKFAADIALESKGFKYLREGSKKKKGEEGGEEEGTGRIWGQEVTWTTTSTAFAAAPGQTTTSIIRYGIGIDKVAELFELAQECGFISKAGSWYKLSYMANVLGDKYDETQYQEQGENKIIERLRSNKNGELSALEDAMQEILQ